MIVFDLSCDQGHRFEGWFGSSGDFASQRERGLLCCPECDSPNVRKAPMAPAVGAKGNQATMPAARKNGGDTNAVANAPMPPELAKAIEKLAEAQKKALKDSKWVGKQFAEQSRAMHYGEADHAPIHGEASVKEAKELADEGVPISPLPFPVAPPDELN